MRIASWNVDSVRARLALVEQWIDAHQPDVLCLQETKVADNRFPVAPFRDAGYEIVTAGEGGQGGVAMAAKAEMVDVVRGIPGAEPPLGERRTISATIGPLRVLSLIHI